MRSAAAIALGVLSDLVNWIWLRFRQRGTLAAEVLFLRRQVALYVQRRVKRRRVGSVERNLTLLPDSPTSAGFLASVSAMIAAIPNVIAAEPGLMLTSPPDIHWRERVPA